MNKDTARRAVGGGAASEAIVRRMTIANSRGLHARAAVRFVKLAGQFEAEIAVRRNDVTVSGLSIMGLMMLAAGLGSEIEVSARGPDAAAAIAALQALVDEKFGED